MRFMHKGLCDYIPLPAHNRKGVGSGLGVDLLNQCYYLMRYHAAIEKGLGVVAPSTEPAAFSWPIVMGRRICKEVHPTSRSPQKKIGFW